MELKLDVCNSSDMANTYSLTNPTKSGFKLHHYWSQLYAKYFMNHNTKFTQA